jgi:hypothetical protein
MGVTALKSNAPPLALLLGLDEWVRLLGGIAEGVSKHQQQAQSRGNESPTQKRGPVTGAFQGFYLVVEVKFIGHIFSWD